MHSYAISLFLIQFLVAGAVANSDGFTVYGHEKLGIFGGLKQISSGLKHVSGLSTRSLQELDSTSSNDTDSIPCFNIFRENGLPPEWPLIAYQELDEAVFPPYTQSLEFDQNNERQHVGVFEYTMNLGNEPALVNGVGVVTDWWTKRPQSVRVYDRDASGALLSGQDYRFYDQFTCGENWNEGCSSEDPSSGLLKINLSEPTWLTAVHVEVYGAMEGNEYSIVEGILVY